MVDDLLRRARGLASSGEDDAARQVYFDLLRADPTHLAGLTELGALAHDAGYTSAARAAFQQAVRCHPSRALARVCYADLLREAGETEAACLHYQAALAVDPDLPRAHQGLAWAMVASGKDAGEHWRKGFAGQAVVRRRYRGRQHGIPLLLLVAAVGGNIPLRHWIDDRVYDVTAIYADFFDPADPLTPHALIMNAIGDADCCGAALANAERIVARSAAPVINRPALVRPTGRADIALRLAGMPGVTVPRIVRLSRATPRFPLLLRAHGYHTGQHFLRVETAEDLIPAAESLPDDDPLVIDYHDVRGADGMFRKYRVMFVDGAAYPLHLAISADWKVHYFTAAMAGNADFRLEEKRFLQDMCGVLGRRGMDALIAIQTVLGLEYAGVDFALMADGSMLVFEANATMVIAVPEADPMWDYRRPAASAALAAARRMLARRVGGDQIVAGDCGIFA